jgi:predicted phosphodiesterase
LRIAILSDIHGNSTALETVLREAASESIERLFVLGDLVGYYYEPLKVLELLAPWNVDFIGGNHELYLSQALTDPARLAAITAKYGGGLETAIQTLSPEQLDFLVKLPITKTVEVDGLKIVLAHGSPWSVEEYLYPDSNATAFDKFATLDCKMVFIGHSHYPFQRMVGDVRVVNSGSVGQPRDIGGLASWMILDTKTGLVVNRRTPFETDELVAQAKNRDVTLPYLHEVLTRNRAPRA